MANTFHQVYIHIVFSVKNRKGLIPKDKKEELHKYITGVVENKNCKMITVNSMPDHIHIFIGLHPSLGISEMVKDIKVSSNKFMNQQKWIRDKFQWQDGFGVFSYSKSQVNKVYKYILNQEEHHKKKTFKEEYLELLNKYGIEYKNEFVFDIE